VDDDAVEARQERPPEVDLGRGSTRQQVVRSEDARNPWADERAVELGNGEPLQVKDVRTLPQQPRHRGHVFEHLERHSQR
jgi:hypothetical protein